LHKQHIGPILGKLLIDINFQRMHQRVYRHDAVYPDGDPQNG